MVSNPFPSYAVSIESSKMDIDNNINNGSNIQQRQSLKQFQYKNEIIHSGHFMISEIEENEEKNDEDDESDNVEVDASTTLNNNEYVGNQSKCVQGTRTVQSSSATKLTYRLKKSNSRVSIDQSLMKLFKCMTLAYNDAKLISPKWKTFKGLKMNVKDKIRLNNIIWRAWHIQYVYGRKTGVCQFSSTIETERHKKTETILLEGKYWRRRADVIKAEYNKWRIYYQHILKTKSKTLQYDWENNLPRWSNNLSFDSLFSTNSNHSDSTLQPLHDNFNPFTFTNCYDYANSREIARSGMGAEFMQPVLDQLQPNIDFMDTFEPIQDFMTFRGQQQTASLMTLPDQQNQFQTNASLKENNFTPMTAPDELFESFFSTDSVPNQQVSATSSKTYASIFSSSNYNSINQTNIPMKSNTENGQMNNQLQTLQQINLLPQNDNFNYSNSAYAMNTPSQPPSQPQQQQHQTISNVNSRSALILNNTGTVNDNLNPYKMAYGISLQQSLDPNRKSSSEIRQQQMLNNNPNAIIYYSQNNNQPSSSGLPISSAEVSNSNPKRPMINNDLLLTNQMSNYQSKNSLMIKEGDNHSQPQPMKAANDTISNPLNSIQQPLPNRFISSNLSTSSTYPSLSNNDLICGTNQQTKTFPVIPEPVQQQQRSFMVVPKQQHQMSNNDSHLSHQQHLCDHSIGNQSAMKNNVPFNDLNITSSTTSTLVQRLDERVSPPSAFDLSNPSTSKAKQLTLPPQNTNKKTYLHHYHHHHRGGNFDHPKKKTVNSVSGIGSNHAFIPIDFSSFKENKTYNIAASPPSNPYGFSELSSSPIAALSSSKTTSPPSNLNLSPISSASSTTSAFDSIVAPSYHQHKSGTGDDNNRVYYKERRRVCHINAEQKRRSNIKNGFDTLRSLLPGLNNNPNTKISKAAMLHKAADYIRVLKNEKFEQQKEYEMLKQQVDNLNQTISVFQSQLPTTGTPIIGPRINRIKEQYNKYVQQKTIENWKFWIFSTIMESLLDTYCNTVATSNYDEMSRTLFQWLEQGCCLTTLRKDVLNSLRYVSTSTNILTNPESIQEEILQAITHTDDDRKNKGKIGQN